MHAQEPVQDERPAASPLLARLAELIAAEGGLLAGALRSSPSGATPHGDLVARGPRSREAVARDADLPLVVETIREGYLLHGGAPRVLDGADEDLALLAGDQLYALGLQRLATAGDLHAVQVLADLIALGAQARAAADDELAEALWEAASVELGWDSQPELAAARAVARTGSLGAAAALRAAARHVAGDLAPAR